VVWKNNIKKLKLVFKSIVKHFKCSSVKKEITWIFNSSIECKELGKKVTPVHSKRNTKQLKIIFLSVKTDDTRQDALPKCVKAERQTQKSYDQKTLKNKIK
jgi:hypothetical protein